MAVTSANRREAVKRRQFYEPLATNPALSHRQRNWQAMRWILAEAAKFPDDEAATPTDQMVELAIRLNEVNEGRRSR